MARDDEQENPVDEATWERWQNRAEQGAAAAGRAAGGRSTPPTEEEDPAAAADADMDATPPAADVTDATDEEAQVPKRRANLAYVGSQDRPSDGEEFEYGSADDARWAAAFAREHDGRAPTYEDYYDRLWSISFARQTGRPPELNDWRVHYYVKYSDNDPDTGVARTRYETRQFDWEPAQPLKVYTDDYGPWSIGARGGKGSGKDDTGGGKGGGGGGSGGKGGAYPQTSVYNTSPEQAAQARLDSQLLSLGAPSGMEGMRGVNAPATYVPSSLQIDPETGQPFFNAGNYGMATSAGPTPPIGTPGRLDWERDVLNARFGGWGGQTGDIDVSNPLLAPYAPRNLAGVQPDYEQDALPFTEYAGAVMLPPAAVPPSVAQGAGGSYLAQLFALQQAIDDKEAAARQQNGSFRARMGGW